MKSFKKITFLCVFLIINLLMSCNLVGTEIKLPSEKPKDFNFIFSYGVGSKNKLDTGSGSYTKDMITEPSVSTNIKLTDEDMDTIYSEMRRINILDYPDYLEYEKDKTQTPYYTYNLKVIIDGVEKNISWEDRSDSESEKAMELRGLFNKIQKMIESTEEYKKLPDVSGGYE